MRKYWCVQGVVGFGDHVCKAEETAGEQSACAAKAEMMEDKLCRYNAPAFTDEEKNCVMNVHVFEIK